MANAGYIEKSVAGLGAEPPPEPVDLDEVDEAYEEPMGVAPPPPLALPAEDVAPLPEASPDPENIPTPSPTPTPPPPIEIGAEADASSMRYRARGGERARPKG